MKRIISSMFVFAAIVLCMEVSYAGGLKYVETANGTQSSAERELVQWTHSRLVFDKDLERIAVGQNSTMEVEILNGREVLVLAKQVGRTSLFVWYPDNTTETFLFSVIEDLSVLRRALADIHENIVIELAPDRAALVLRGTVPTMRYRYAAEAAARNYFEAGNSADPGAGVVVQDDGPGLGDLATAAKNALSGASAQEQATIINLIQVHELPLAIEQRIKNSIATIGGAEVQIERVMRGGVENDSRDTLILKGKVKNQVTLVRVLNIATRIFVGFETGMDTTKLTAIADESGGLIASRGTGSAQGSGLGLAGLPGSQGAGSNYNDIKSNVARSKLISAAGGRILSMIEVTDLPQVRVSVQLHEVDRTRMKNWRPDLTAVTGGFAANSMSADGSGLVIQPSGAERVGATESRQIENALQILGGTLSNQLQIGGSDIAFDLLFSLLESEGISRTLSRPTLTTLAGEPAVFQVGGEVPVPTSFAPAGVSSGDTSGGVFSGTEFKAFGVQLMVRAMVDENDRITLDVRPSISTPDATLTQVIAGSTGSALNSAAFSTRSLDTTTRLRDGQSLVIGGLVSRSILDSKAYTPGIHNTPLLGKLAEASQKSDGDRELVIVVTPTIVREPIEHLSLWEFPDVIDLLDRAVTIPGARHVEQQQNIYGGSNHVGK